MKTKKEKGLTVGLLLMAGFIVLVAAMGAIYHDRKASEGTGIGMMLKAISRGFVYYQDK